MKDRISHYVVMVGILVIGIVIISAAVTQKPQTDADKTAQAAVQQLKETQFHTALGGAMMIRETLRNPDSFKLASALVMGVGEGDKLAICYEYRAQNGFGGMDLGQAVMTNHAFLSTGDAGFRALWAKRCAGQRGADLADEVTTGLHIYDQQHAN